MNIEKFECVLEGILFASGEPMTIDRIAAVLASTPDEVIEVSKRLAERLENDHRGIRLIRLENSLQLCSAPEYSDYIRMALETRKPPKLTQNALEVLSIVAYFQPVTRAYIEQIRGVDSSYTVSVLLERGLIEQCGHLDAPGRPTLFKTTNNFLRTFGISSIDQLPPLPETKEDEEQQKIKENIDMLSSDEFKNIDNQ
jgi:segregation and condensation protein B